MCIKLNININDIKQLIRTSKSLFKKYNINDYIDIFLTPNPIKLNFYNDKTELTISYFIKNNTKHTITVEKACSTIHVLNDSHELSILKSCTILPNNYKTHTISKEINGINSINRNYNNYKLSNNDLLLESYSIHIEINFTYKKSNNNKKKFHNNNRIIVLGNYFKT